MIFFFYEEMENEKALQFFFFMKNMLVKRT